MEPNVEHDQRVMVRAQRVEDMAQFQEGRITNMIPNADRPKK